MTAAIRETLHEVLATNGELRLMAFPTTEGPAGWWDLVVFPPLGDDPKSYALTLLPPADPEQVLRVFALWAWTTYPDLLVLPPIALALSPELATVARAIRQRQQREAN